MIRQIKEGSRTLIFNRKGQALCEYAVIGSLLVIVYMALDRVFAEAISAYFTRIALHILMARIL